MSPQWKLAPAIPVLLALLMFVACKNPQSIEEQEPEAKMTVQATPTPEAEEGARQGPPVPTLVPRSPETIRADSGVVVDIYEPSLGTPAKGAKAVQILYTASLTDGTEIESVRNPDNLFRVVFEQGSGVPGLDEGLQLLRAGDKARVTIPAELAWPESRRPASVPAGADVVFDVHMVVVEP